MRIAPAMALSLMALSSVCGQTDSAKNRLSTGYVAEPRISMWIWSDKQVYKTGDSLTLRWTVKTNNDAYPYTVFVYRQNNQTGIKSYLPGNDENVTDLSGRTLSQGFQAAPLKDVAKSVL